MFSHQDLQPKQRPTVVLLHSSASSGRQWEALTAALQPRFHVHAMDFHGHGARAAWRNDAPPLTLADEAALAAPLLADVGGGHIVGHSYGAAVALKLTSMHPALVRSLTVYEPVMFRWLIDDDSSHETVQDIVAVADAMRDRLARGQEHSAAQRFIDFWCGDGSWDSMPSGSRNSIGTRMHAVLQHFGALFREPLRRTQVARLRIPMLFMAGARTVAITRRLAARLRLAFPHAQHQELSGMGHMGPMTHPAEVNRRIVEFLHTHASPGSAFEPWPVVA